MKSLFADDEPQLVDLREPGGRGRGREGDQHALRGGGLPLEPLLHAAG